MGKIIYLEDRKKRAALLHPRNGRTQAGSENGSQLVILRQTLFRRYPA